jgi:hypothetical protein
VSLYLSAQAPSKSQSVSPCPIFAAAGTEKTLTFVVLIQSLGGGIHGKTSRIGVNGIAVESTEDEFDKRAQARGRGAFCAWQTGRREILHKAEASAFGRGSQEDQPRAEGALGKAGGGEWPKGDSET